MKYALKYLGILTIAFCGIAGLSSFLKVHSSGKTRFIFPYKQAGLTERQAAAHLLSRFTYGATPGQIDQVVNMGLEKWFDQQLDGVLPDDSLNERLSSYDALKLTNREVVALYPRNGAVIRMAVKDGVIDKDSIKADKKEYRSFLLSYMQQHGLKPQQELFRQFYNQKILRSAYTQNQLREVLTDFWFNHFNVSTTKNDCAAFIPSYERDVIRPNVTGKFGDLLLATAKSPAMLYYLDNFSSSGGSANDTDNPARRRRLEQLEMQAASDPDKAQALEQFKKGKRAQGLNENYAREVMELHTLGVDGGYTQQDVTQAAKVLTGWSVFPMGQYGNANALNKRMAGIGEDKLAERGFVHDGDFLFIPTRHDTGLKTVLGRHFEHSGYQEGVDLLYMLAHHPSTAKFITRKIAIRFVSDNPPQSLLDKMARTFTEKDGDIRAVLITMATAPEFWDASAVREKTKSPFELVISSVRSLNATIDQPFQLYRWTSKMGQKMYAYQAPTGFPDKGQYWINTGALLNRMNFGLAMASQRIPGVRIDLAALNNNHEPESPEAALSIYSKLIIPGRNTDATIRQLKPMLSDPDLLKKISDAADKAAPPAPQDRTGNNEDVMSSKADREHPRDDDAAPDKMVDSRRMQRTAGNNSMLAQVVGIIIGSPEFQRR